MIDAALAHHIHSEQNIRTARDELDPATVQHFNTDALGVRYRTRVESRWR
ncbi:DUF7386 family protein [Halorubrum sp. DTA98]